MRHIEGYDARSMEVYKGRELPNEGTRKRREKKD